MLPWQRHIPQPSYQKSTGCVVNLLACCHFWRPKVEGIKTVFGHLKVIQLKVFLDHSASRKLKSQEVLQIANTVTQIASLTSGDVIARDWRENFIAVSHKAARA